MWQGEEKKKVTGERGRWAKRKLPAYTYVIYSLFNRGFYELQLPVPLMRDLFLSF